MFLFKYYYPCFDQICMHALDLNRNLSPEFSWRFLHKQLEVEHTQEKKKKDERGFKGRRKTNMFSNGYLRKSLHRWLLVQLLRDVRTSRWWNWRFFFPLFFIYFFFVANICWSLARGAKPGKHSPCQFTPQISIGSHSATAAIKTLPCVCAFSRSASPPRTPSASLPL